jgi:hypothetical protein
MPQLLRHDAVRLFEGSLEALDLAVSSVSARKRVSFRESAAEFSQEIGLIGASAELAMGACLVHAYGPSALLRDGKKYKTFPNVLDDFRQLISESRPVSAFLTRGVAKPAEHREALRRAVGTFGRLAVMRASGLHCACKRRRKSVALWGRRNFVAFRMAFGESVGSDVGFNEYLLEAIRSVYRHESLDRRAASGARRGHFKT